MKNRSLFRLLALAALMLVSGLNARAQAPDAFYVYKNDGSVMPFFNDLVDSVKWSHYDLNGVEHKAYVVQEIYTADSLYRIPVELIDSIGFHKPENKYTADAVRMEQQPWWRYVAEFVDTLNVIVLRADTPEDILPKVGDKLVTTVQNDIFPGGFMGRVVYMAPLEDGGEQVIVCEPLDFKDVFVEFTASTGVVTESEEAEARSGERKRHIDLDKLMKWPKVDFLSGTWGWNLGGSYDMGGDKSRALCFGQTYSVEPQYDITLWVHWSIETGLEYDFHLSGTATYKETDYIQGTGSWHKDLVLTHIKKPMPYVPILYWFVEPGFFVDASASANLYKTSSKTYRTVINAQFFEYEPDRSFCKSKTMELETKASDTKAFSIGGSVSAGFYTEFGLRLPPVVQDKDSKLLIARIQLGARLEANLEVNLTNIADAFKDFSVYQYLNHEAQVSLTAFLSGEIKLQLPNGLVAASAPAEITLSKGAKLGIVPAFDNVDVTTGKLDSIYYAICHSDVARNLLFPTTKMGFTLRDSKGNAKARVGNRDYWLTTFENMTDTISGLEPGMKYSLHPSFDFLGFIPMLGYPKKDFTVGTLKLDFKPDPITATRERNVLRLPINTNGRRTGVTVTDGSGWLHAVTDSLTLLVRTDSLPGGTTREGKLKLKAMTTDPDIFVEQEVKVIQTGLPMIELEPESVGFLPTGGTERVTVRLMEPDRTVSVSGQPDWLGVEVSGQTITLTAQPNPDKVRPRTCTLTVIATDKGGSRAERPLPVAQQCEQAALVVEPKEVVFEALPPVGSNWNITYMNVSVLKSVANSLRFTVTEGSDWLKTGGTFVRTSEEGDYYIGTIQVYTDQPNTNTKEERGGVVIFTVTLADNSTVEEKVVVRQKPLEPIYNLTPGKITLLAAGDNNMYSDLQQVAVETNLIGYHTYISKAEITPSEDWLMVSGNWWGPIGIYAYTNIEPDSRSAEVNIKLTLDNGEVVERTIYVTQKGTADNRKFDISPARLEFPGAGGEKTLTIVPAQGVEIDRIWEVDCHTAGNSWLNGSGMNLKLIMTAEPNPSKGMRQRDFAVTVLLKDGTKVTENFIAYQKPAGIDLYPSQIEMSPFGGIEYANMETSAEPVTITTDVDWLTVTRSGNAIFVEADMWCGDQRRYGHVDLQATLDDGTVVKNSLFVNQQSTYGFFRTEPSKRTVEAEGGKDVFGGTIVVNSSYEQASQVTDISLSSNVDWITPKRGGNSGFQLYYDIAANATGKERVGEVFLAAKLNNGKVVTAHQYVTQKVGSAQPITLSLSPSSLNFGDTGGSGNVSITTDADASNISVKTSASWIHATRSGTTISVSADANTSTSSRSGSVTVTVSQDGQTATQTISVSQSGKNQGQTTELPIDITGASIYFDLNPDYIEATNKEEFSGWDGYRGGPGLFSAAVPYNGYHYGTNEKRYSENLRAWMEGDYVIVEGEQHSGFVTSDVSDYMHDVTDRIHLKFKASNPADPTTYVLVDGSVNQKDWNTEWYGPDNYTAIVNYECTNTTSFNIKSNIPFSSGSYNSGFTYEVSGSSFNSNHLSNYEFDFNLVSHHHDISDRKYHISGVKIMNSSYNYMRVVLQAKELPKNYSGGFIGEWHNGSTTLILREDGTFYKKEGSAAAVTGTYELLSYELNGLNFSGTLKEPGGKVVSFSGAYPYDDLWPSTMKYDGVGYRFDDGM